MVVVYPPRPEKYDESSIGMMIIPNIWENKHVPNHQPDYTWLCSRIIFVQYLMRIAWHTWANVRTVHAMWKSPGFFFDLPSREGLSKGLSAFVSLVYRKVNLGLSANRYPKRLMANGCESS